MATDPPIEVPTRHAWPTSTRRARSRRRRRRRRVGTWRRSGRTPESRGRGGPGRSRAGRVRVPPRAGEVAAVAGEPGETHHGRAVGRRAVGACGQLQPVVGPYPCDRGPIPRPIRGCPSVIRSMMCSMADVAAPGTPTPGSPDRGNVVSGYSFQGPRRGADRAVLLAHGAGSDREGAALRAVADALAAAGVPSLRFDYPYRSAGRRAPDRPPVLDAATREAAAELARRIGAPAGTARARRPVDGRARAARSSPAARPESPRPSRPSASLLLGYPLHPDGQARAAPRRPTSGTSRCPVLFESGTRDTLAPRPELTRSARKVKGPVTLHWIDTADHGYRPLKSSGRTPAEVLADVADRVRPGCGGPAQVGAAATIRAPVSRTRGELRAPRRIVRGSRRRAARETVAMRVERSLRLRRPVRLHPLHRRPRRRAVGGGAHGVPRRRPRDRLRPRRARREVARRRRDVREHAADRRLVEASSR